MNYRWPQMVATNLKQIVPSASSEGLDLLRRTLMWDPKKRPQSVQCLRHGFFTVGNNLNNSQKLNRPQQQNTGPKPVQITKEPALPSLGHANTTRKPLQEKDPLNIVTAKKSAQKRIGGGISSDWDDIDDLGLSMSLPRKNSHIAASTRRPSIGYNKTQALPTKQFDDMDDFEDILNSIGNPAPKPPTQTRQDSGRRLSASQRYQKMARYKPGIYLCTKDKNTKLTFYA